jgi:hypothetical protein
MLDIPPIASPNTLQRVVRSVIRARQVFSVVLLAALLLAIWVLAVVYLA